MKKRGLGLFVSLIGFGATVYLTARAAPKVKEQFEKEKPETIKEKTKIIFKEAGPAIAVGVATVGSMVFIDHKRKQEINKWCTLFTLSDQIARKYRNEIAKKLGWDEEKTITENVLSNTIQMGGTENDYYEPYSGRTFRLTENEMLEWEYRFNKFFTENGMATLTDFLEINGEKGDSRTDGYGWSALDEVYWVDISHKEKLADGKYLLDFETGPSTTYLYSTLSSMGYDYDPDLEKPGV